jgi:VWFA-related protein
MVEEPAVSHDLTNAGAPLKPLVGLSGIAVLILFTMLATSMRIFAQGPPDGGPPPGPPPDSQPNNGSFTIKVNSDLVLTNVVVRDKKTGEVVRGLKQSDFTILENGKPQKISTFDFESVDQATPLNEATVSGMAGSTAAKSPTQNIVATNEQLRNHRLIVFFFDLTSMQPEDIDRSVDAAKNYVNKQMQPADLVAVVSLNTSLSLDQDFTANKPALLHAVGAYNGSEGQGFAPGATSTTNTVEDSTAYTADESEYNDINTDRELFAISTISKSLAYIDEKKSLLYFSGGISRDGIENQASLRNAINAAVRANLSIYSVDTRGLQAISPLGDATTGSLRGTGAFNGSALQNNLDANFNSQEVMSTLSTDTGGKAFFDSNDFAPAFQRVQNDTSAYYVLGFRSADPRRDGRYRKLQVKLNRNDVKLEYRQGYYAPADFKHSTNEDRERQLDEELASDLPATDVAVYLQALYFRVDETHYFVPVSIVVPGSQIPFTKGGDRDKATLDIIGEVKDAAGRDIGDARQTVKLAIDQSPAGLAQEHSVLHRIHPADRQVPSEVRRPRKRDRQDGLLRDRHQRARPAQDTAQAKLRRARQPAHAQHKQERPQARSSATASSSFPTCPMSSARTSTSTCSTRFTIPATPDQEGIGATKSLQTIEGRQAPNAPVRVLDQHRIPQRQRLRSTKLRSSRPKNSILHSARGCLPVRRPARPAQIRRLHLPGQRNRRRRRQLQLSPVPRCWFGTRKQLRPQLRPLPRLRHQAHNSLVRYTYPRCHRLNNHLGNSAPPIDN